MNEPVSKEAVMLSGALHVRRPDNIGHGAHVTGAVFGLIFTIVAAKVVADYDVVKAFLEALQRR